MTSHIRNRSPAAGRDKTPRELCHGRQADVAGIRMFCVQAFALVSKELRRKLDSPLGAGSFCRLPHQYHGTCKGFKTLLPSGKVIVSADITFAFLGIVSYGLA